MVVYRQPAGSIPLFILLGMLASTLLWVLSIASMTAWYLELHNYVQLRCVHSNMALIFTCMLCVVVALRRLVVLGGPCDTLESRVWIHVNTLEV